MSNHLHPLAIHALCLTTCLSGCTSTRDAAPEQNTEVITHALELPCHDVERSPVSASFKNGFAMEPAFMDDLSPKGGACFFPDGSRANAYTSPSPTNYDVYIELGGDGVFHKFEVRFKQPPKQRYHGMPGFWRVPMEPGVDLIAYAAYDDFRLHFTPTKGACAFPEGFDLFAYKELLETARIVYGGYRPGTKEYYYWDHAGLAPSSSEGFHFTYITSFHNPFVACVTPRETLAGP